MGILMLRLRLIVIATTVALAACSPSSGGADKSAADASAPASASTAPAVTDMTNNPFFHASTLPFQAPPFDKIKDSDYQPAIEEGMKRELAEIEKIANNPEAPTFDNTLVAMEKSGVMLHRVMAAFDAVTGANTMTPCRRCKKTKRRAWLPITMRSTSTASCSSASRRSTTSATR